MSVGPNNIYLLRQNMMCRGNGRYTIQELEHAAINSPILQDAIIAAGGMDLLWCKTRAMSMPPEEWPIDFPDKG